MRNVYFDNLKFVLISLVVVGHFFARYRADSEVLNGMHLFLYLFHMPVFAFVSGYFSKTFSPRFKDISFILIPYLVFQVLYVGFYKLLGLDDGAWTGGFSITWPFEQNWYLLSLLGWRLMSIYARQCRFALLIAFGLTFLAGLEPALGWDYSASRTICFFPFFLLGMRADEGGLEKMARLKVPALLVLSGLLGCCMLLAVLRPATTNMLTWMAFYADGYDGALRGLAYRAVLYSISLAGGAAFLALIPRKTRWYTRLGERTMTVFLLHNFFVFGLKKIYPTYQAGITELVLLVSVVGTIALLSSRWIHQALLSIFSALGRLISRTESVETSA